MILFDDREAYCVGHLVLSFVKFYKLLKIGYFQGNSFSGDTLMKKKYIVRLTSEERSQLLDMVSKGRAAAYKIKHANILLKVDANGPDWSDKQVAEAFSCVEKTVFNIRQRFVEQGVEAALNRKKRETPPNEPILDGEKEARLFQIACSEPPQGYAKWSLRLLAKELVALDIVETISPPTIMRTLKKMNSNPISVHVG